MLSDKPTDGQMQKGTRGDWNPVTGNYTETKNNRTLTTDSRTTTLLIYTDQHHSKETQS